MSPVDITPDFNPLRLASDRRLNRIAGPSGLVIFGVTGDLSRKKLMPAVYDLANRGLLPPGFALVGFARRDWETQDFEQVVHEAVKQYARTPFDEDVWRQLAQGIRFVQGEFNDDEAFVRLKRTIEELDRDRGTMGNHAFYLSIPPKSFPQVTEQLRRSGLADQKDGQWRRVVIEKPFGSDLTTARDVIQNHLLQLLALTAMEEPVSFNAADLRAEKEKVLSAVLLPKDLSKATARGQYSSGWQGGEKVIGFLEEEGMNPGSLTETFAAIRLDIGTRRWAGVPFYLRAGKRLGRRVTEIAVVFKRAPQYLFAESQTSALGQNALVIRVQPDEGVTIRFGSKVPGPSMQVRDVTMDFGYGHAFTEASPEAYERLILDVLLGDPPLFPRHQEVELSWKILDPIEEFWATQGQPEQYRPGTWGPSSADDLLARDGRTWRRP